MFAIATRRTALQHCALPCAAAPPRTMRTSYSTVPSDPSTPILCRALTMDADAPALMYTERVYSQLGVTLRL